MNEEWDGFVDASPQGCIFQKSWWLDAVAPGRNDLLLIRRGGSLAAGMPIVWSDSGRFKCISMPPLTQVLGILFPPSSAKPAKRLANEHELAVELMEQIPPCDRFSLRFHYQFSNWSPFFWGGYSQTTKYTYVIDEIGGEAEVWSGVRDNIRREIRKAQRADISIRDDCGLEAMYETISQTFARQGMKTPYSLEFVKRLDTACTSVAARRMLFAVDPQNRIHAAGYYVWDARTTYFLMGGGNPALRNSGANSLMHWQAIQEARERGTKYDFEGSMIRGVQRFFQSFGALPKAYSQISRTNSLRLEGREWLQSYARRVMRYWRNGRRRNQPTGRTEPTGSKEPAA